MKISEATRPEIIFIDDDPIDQVMYKRLVDRCDVFLRAEYFSYADDAYDSFCEDESIIPDIIVVDINIPRMSGLEFIDAMESRFPHRCDDLFVVIASTSICSKDQKVAENFKCVRRLIEKPLRPEQLESLAKCVESFRA